MADRHDGATLWDESGSKAARAQAELLQQVAGGPAGYSLERIILTNFWLYDHQEFEIPHGRLFLAGDNRSGKSTILTAAITLALDGDYRPERIDTFGKREKRIDYYVIGSQESNTPYIREQRTTYIALEFAWRGLNQPPFATELRERWERGDYERARYLTIGVAFYGNRNSATAITCTRFLITDGSRLEKNFSTMHETSSGRRACDLRTFKKLITEHGLLCETQREYEQKVAHYLFHFADLNDFHRLIRQLLYLRQPNLNSVLSLEAVRTFLDQSLPALPNDLIQHAATTLELMDALQEEIERRQKAYTAVERLHRAQQSVSLVQARLAACEYIHDQFQTDAAQSEMQRVRRIMTRAENDLRRFEIRIADLEREQIELTGQVAALEGSEGLQAARRLHQARETVQQLTRSLSAQQEILADTIERREQTDRTIQTQHQDFTRMHQQSSELLAELQRLAGRIARWSIAADQLDETLREVRALSLEAAVPHIPTRVSSLQEVPVRERLNWLRTLKRMHQETKEAALKLQLTQDQEKAAYETLDAATRQFERARESLCAAQQDLADRLDILLEGSAWHAPFLPIHERASLVWNASGIPQEIVEQLHALQQEYQREIERVRDALKLASRRLQEDLEKLKRQQGARQAAVERAWNAYEQKRQEPEYVPARSAHRARARQVLAAHGLPALPLYMLFAFTGEGEEQETLAGGIEYLLEDAGLLDALVVPATDTGEADALLAHEGLSDCRLDLTRLVPHQAEHEPSAWSSGLLRVDPALRETLGEQAAAWEEIAGTILPVLERDIFPALAPRDAPRQSIPWTHGLLRGSAGAGTARCIGRATRLREQQRALVHLRQQWETLESELRAIESQIADLELRRRQQEDMQSGLNEVWQASASASQLNAALALLDQAETRYQEIHSEAQMQRQHITTLRVNLHKMAGDEPIFASAAELVEQAYDATGRLASEQRTLVSYLDRLRAAWQEHHRAQEQLAQDKAAEWRAAQAQQRAEAEVQRASAELETLRQLVQQTEQGDITTLLERLQTLQARQQSLPTELQTAREKRAVAESTWQDNQENVTKAQAVLAACQQRRDETWQRFLARFDAYPVELLVALKPRFAEQSALEVAQSVLETPQESLEEEYHARKRELEERHTREQNILTQVVYEVNSLLHEYAPQSDEQGIIRFQNAEQANAAQLLNRLGEEISQQQQLLEVRERELFQNFLLEEMADAIGKHITDAEGWVKRMNAVLGQTAFVGAYYHLRWTPRKEEETGPGSQLARYHDLLRRQAQTFKQEEIDQLVYAFRQEINALRTQARATNALSFGEALAHIFDYRAWFQFEIFTTRPDGSSLHLTNRFFKKGSGAEQYVTLYIPFFAALSALYDSAGQGAPRLIALDEAFDKVSVENTRQLLTFLASQQFQWIMTGPRVTGEGATIPACVKYTMFCEKERELAAGFPSFWSADLTLAGERERRV